MLKPLFYRWVARRKLINPQIVGFHKSLLATTRSFDQGISLLWKFHQLRDMIGYCMAGRSPEVAEAAIFMWSTKQYGTCKAHIGLVYRKQEKSQNFLNLVKYGNKINYRSCQYGSCPHL